MKLKVFRIAIGFHDAYVAAPTKKAAIEAWGSGKDVFTRGEAEIVTDAKLSRAPLAEPGKVIKVLRGTAAEQLAALEPDEPKQASPGKKSAAARAKKAAPRPRPSRAKLDAAETALAKAEQRQAKAIAAIEKREAKLARERKALEQAYEEERAALETAQEAAGQAYRDAMDRWRADG